MSNTQDRKILEGIAKGDQEILKGFYKKNLPYIQRYILQNSGNHEDVEDVFQDALVLMYQKVKTGSLELQSSLNTYFYAICKNIWRNRLRKHKKLVVIENTPDTEDIDSSVIQEIENKEREHVYRKYFVKLSDTCKKILSLVFDGNSMRDIAQLTGYSEAYTRKKKFECKKSLIQMIEKDPIFQELKVTSHKE